MARKSQGHVSFFLTRCMGVREVVALYVVSKRELYDFAHCCSKYIYITFLLGLVFITYSFKYVKWGQGKVDVFYCQSGNSQGILFRVLGMNHDQKNRTHRSTLSLQHDAKGAAGITKDRAMTKL